MHRIDILFGAPIKESTATPGPPDKSGSLSPSLMRAFRNSPGPARNVRDHGSAADDCKDNNCLAVVAYRMLPFPFLRDVTAELDDLEILQMRHVVHGYPGVSLFGLREYRGAADEGQNAGQVSKHE
ncbi:MAG: hypothetical protein WD795_03495 [Woeseia sp.]